MNDLKLFNLTIPQKAIFLSEQYSSGTNLNSIGGNIIIEEKVDLDLLEKALNIFVKNNDALRIRIHMEDSIPMQYIVPYEPFYLKRVFLKDKQDLDKLTSETVACPFNFFDSSLFNFTLFKFEDGTGGLTLSFHHIISDAWSISLFVDGIIKIYSNLLNNTTINENENNSYLDFVKSEQDYFNTSRFKKDKEFWNSFFSSEPEHIIISNKKEKNITTTAKRKSFLLDKELYKKITSLCKEANCSLFTFFMAIYSLYLARINNSNFSTIGTPILNRTNVKEKSTCGIFTGTQPFCLNIDYNMSFNDFLKNVMCSQIKFFRHQKYPYSTLLEDLKNMYNISYNLYDLAFSYQNARANATISNIKFHTNWFLMIIVQILFKFIFMIWMIQV